jgi:hypothetical protein
VGYLMMLFQLDFVASNEMGKVFMTGYWKVFGKSQSWAIQLQFQPSPEEMEENLRIATSLAMIWIKYLPNTSL